VIFGNENEFVFFSFFSIESDLGPNFSRFRVNAERLGLADVLVVHFEEVSEENVFNKIISCFVFSSCQYVYWNDSDSTPFDYDLHLLTALELLCNHGLKH
jgi:hypothetical protein